METLNWLQQPLWLTLLLVFLVAFGESLALIGIVVPGATLMIVFGALIAGHFLPFWPTVLAAFLGAVLGDGLSFWLGARYHVRLATLWPLSRYPHLLPQGEAFFKRHGGKSVFLGRFFGPIRAIIPAVAGMAHMPAARFYLINIASALVWAPAYLLPGILFGASLQLASEYAGRITLLLVCIVLALLLLAGMIKFVYRVVTPHTDRLMARLVNWSQRHPLVGEIPAALLVAEHRETRGLSILALLMLLATSGFILVSQLASHFPFIHNINNLVFHALNETRSPPFDHLMVFITSLGDPMLLAMLVLITACGLWLKRHHLALWHWLAACLLPALLVELLKRFYAMPRPPGLDTLIGYAYPSGHATLSVAVYGFLAILLCGHIKPRWRSWVYLFTASLVTLIGFSRLYLGAHWFTDVIGGMLLGLGWLTFIGIAYRRHRDPTLLMRGKWRYWPLLLLLPLLLYPLLNHQLQMQRYTPQPQQYVMGYQAWLRSGWQVMPAHRNDLRNYHDFPFTVQWMSDIETIDKVLTQNGWQAVRNRPLQYLNWLNPAAKLDKLPIPPHVHDGRYDDYRWIKSHNNDQLTVLRLWIANHDIETPQRSVPLWYGYVSTVLKSGYFGLTFVKTDSDFAQPLNQLRKTLGPCQIMERQREQQMQQVILIQKCE